MPAIKFPKTGTPASGDTPVHHSPLAFYRRPPRVPASPPVKFVHRVSRSRDFALFASLLCLLALLCNFELRSTLPAPCDEKRSLLVRDPATANEAGGGGVGGSGVGGKLGASEVGGGGEVHENGYQKYLGDLEPFDAFNLSHPMVGAYAKLAEEYLASWTKYEGVKQGVGSRGLVQVSMIESMGERPEWMSCGTHIRITDGKVYFRYGHSIALWYRLLRHIQTLKIIQDAVTHFRLSTLKADLLFNTCDMPISFDSTQTNGERSGFPVFSTQHLEGSTDIIVPDPLDLQKDYMPEKRAGAGAGAGVGVGAGLGGEDTRKRVAVFRGSATNYLLKARNWRANPRFRLHLMSIARPDLLDAKIVRFSKATSLVAEEIRKDGFRPGRPMKSTEMSGYRYEVVVDGGAGTCRTCGVLASEKLTIRQASAFRQFYEPLLAPFNHYLPTQHNFQDLFDRVTWAQTHEPEAQKVVKNANEIAQWTCTWEGRRLYWAILLVKYQNLALEDPHNVKAPEKVCKGRPIITQDLTLPHDMPKCGSKESEELSQPDCTFFCVGGRIDRDKWQWVEAKVFDKVKEMGPRMDGGGGGGGWKSG